MTGPFTIGRSDPRHGHSKRRPGALGRKERGPRRGPDPHAIYSIHTVSLYEVHVRVWLGLREVEWNYKGISGRKS